MISATTVFDLAVYVGTTSFVGNASEVDLPTIESTTSDYEALGMMGTLRVAVGKEPMEARIAWQGHGVKVSTVSYNLEEVQDFMIRTYIEEQGAVAKVRTPVIFTFRGIVRSKEGGNFTSKSAMTHEITIDVMSFREKIGDRETVRYDPKNNIYTLNGRNMWAERNAILGL